MLITHFYRRIRTNFSDPGHARESARAGGREGHRPHPPAHGDEDLPGAGALGAGAGAAGPSPEINAINTAWTLIAAFLVFGMQVGFVMLEAGFARSRESINILVEGIVDTCICGVTFWAWGFAFMFEPGNGFIGTTRLLPEGPRRHLRHDRRAAARVLGVPVRVRRHLLDDHVGRDGRPLRLRRRHPLQHRRHRLHLSDHRPLGAGARTAGWRSWPRRSATSPARRSCTRIGGAISLVGAIALGPRLGRVFARDGGGPPLPHNIILGAVGGLILWFGWYGFNPGSTLSALDVQGIGRVSFNTTMAACSAGLAALFYAYARIGNGTSASRRTASWPGSSRSPARATGSARPARSSSASSPAFVVIWATDALEYLRIDDPIGAVPVHMVCGIWGTLSLGLFATGAYGLPTPTGVDTSGRREGPVLRRRHGAAHRAGDRQRRGRLRDARRRRSS